MLNARYLDRSDLEELGFAQLGRDVLLHATCVIVGADRIALGDGVRVDPFTIISANESVEIGAYSHIAAHCTLAGGSGLTIGAFAGVSHGSHIFSASDDYRDSGLLGPQIPDDLRIVHSARVRLGKHSCVGANSVVLPGAVLGEGATVGALSLVQGSLSPWCVHAGIPARMLSERPRARVLEAEAEFLRRLAVS